MKNKLFDIPFDETYFYNPVWEVESPKPSWIDQEEYDKCVREYEEAEAKVLFKDIIVGYESCDCGGEYGCGHPAYPYDMKINDDEEIECVFEDDGIYVQNKNGHIKFDNLKNISIGHFVTACELLGIELKYANVDKSSNATVAPN